MTCDKRADTPSTTAVISSMAFLVAEEVSCGFAEAAGAELDAIDR
jgi:hypothetical protein